MARKGRKGRKVRVDFRQNRQQPRRTDDWTRRLREDEDAVVDERLSESVRAKGDLSRKRTIIVDDDDTPVVDETLWQRGIVTAVHGLVVRVDDEQGQSWDCTTRRVLRTMLTQQRSRITVGDKVWISDHARLQDGERVGVIERVAPRATILSRRDTRGREHTLVANADQLLIVGSIAQPGLKPHLIDRYLVAAGKGDLRPIICFNKCDLEAETVELADGADELTREVAHGLSCDAIIAEFEALGYRCLRTSATTGAGVAELKRELTDHVTVLSGQSGVGKSSLINMIEPGLDLEVSAVSTENEKGRHTTTIARLLPLGFGGYVVDTPGIRQFDLWAMEPGELEAFFIDFLPYIPQCRFNDCHHVEETGCAVIAAAEDGQISLRRYFSYRKMLEEAAQRLH